MPILALCFALLLSIADAASAAKHPKGAKPPVKGATYKGTTSEKGEISFTVSSSGKSILSFTTSIGYNGECGAGGGPGFEVKVKSIAIRSGKFSAKTKGVFPSSTLKVEPMKLKVTGKIAGSKASGTVAEIGGKCSEASANPYSETFTATAP